MKWLVFAGALAIGIASFAIRTPAADRTAVSGRRVVCAPPKLQLENLPTQCPDAQSDQAPSVLIPSNEAGRISLPAQPLEQLNDESLNSREEVRALREQTVLVMERGLDLSPPQSRQIEQILCERDSTIDQFHSEIRASKVFCVWKHEKRTREILAAVHQKILAVLSSDQTRSYERLIEEKKIIVGISFEITPELTVIR